MPSVWQYLDINALEDEQKYEEGVQWANRQKQRLADLWADEQRKRLNEAFQESMRRQAEQFQEPEQPPEPEEPPEPGPPTIEDVQRSRMAPWEQRPAPETFAEQEAIAKQQREPRRPYGPLPAGYYPQPASYYQPEIVEPEPETPPVPEPPEPEPWQRALTQQMPVTRRITPEELPPALAPSDTRRLPAQAPPESVEPSAPQVPQEPGMLQGAISQAAVGANRVNEFLRRVQPGYAGVADIAGPPLKSLVGKELEVAGAGLEYYQRKVIAPLAQLTTQISRSAIPTQGLSLTARDRELREILTPSKPEAPIWPAGGWDELAEQWESRKDLPEGYKFLSEVLIDPLNIIPLELKQILAGLRAAKSAMGKAVEVGREAAERATPVIRKLVAEETGGLGRKAGKLAGEERGEIGWRVPAMPQPADKLPIGSLTEESGWRYAIIPTQSLDTVADNWLKTPRWERGEWGLTNYQTPSVPQPSREDIRLVRARSSYFRQGPRAGKAYVEVYTNQGWKPLSDVDRGQILYQGAHRAGDTPIVSGRGAYGPGTYVSATSSRSVEWAERHISAKTSPSAIVTKQEAIDAVQSLKRIMGRDVNIKPWAISDKPRGDVERRVAAYLWRQKLGLEGSPGLVHPYPKDQWRGEWEFSSEIESWLDEIFPTRIAGGQNVRPIYVPEDMRFLDADRYLTPEDTSAIAQSTELHLRFTDNGNGVWQAVSNAAFDAEMGRYNQRTGKYATGEEWTRMKERADAQAQRLLSSAGYDGLKFNGGRDFVIFPDSLHKTRNAFTGEEGGRSGAGLAIDIGAGAVGAAGAYDPDASPEENAWRMTLGAAGLGTFAHYALKGKLGMQVQMTGDPGNDALLRMYANASKPPPTNILKSMQSSWTAAIRHATNNKIDIARLVQGAEKEAHRKLTDTENVYLLRRYNPNGAANQFLTEHIAPVYRELGKDMAYLDNYLTHLHDIDIVAAKANPDRLFSAGRVGRDVPAQLDALKQFLGPQRLARIDQAATFLNAVVGEMRNYLVDSDVMSPQLADALGQIYPHYVPTVILDYIREPGNIAVGKGVSLMDSGIRRLTQEGTTRDREAPTVALVRYIQESFARGQQNRVFKGFLAVRDLDPALKAAVIETKTKPIANQAIVEGFDGGVKRRFLAPKELNLMLNTESPYTVPVFSPINAVMRQLLTGRNPLFLTSNALVDLGTYAIRATMREAGPLEAKPSSIIKSIAAPVFLPKVLAELALAYQDVFRGILKNEYTGRRTSEYLLEGGAVGGWHGGQAQLMAKTRDTLARDNVFVIDGWKDIGRLLRGIATLEPVAAVGERIELAPHVAQAQLALKRGLSPQRAVIGQGRDVTIDFEMGGDFSKRLSQILLFFNPAAQAAVQPVRAFRENPLSFTSTLAALIGGPIVAAETWNRANPQRSRDYDDVPQKFKDIGIVIMLPGEAPVDKSGQRRPVTFIFPLRDWAPLGIIAKEILNRSLGREPRAWLELAAAAGLGVSPVQGGTPEEAISSFAPALVSTGLQLASNYNYMTGGRIATEAANERASAISGGIAERVGMEPAQVEFAARDIGGGPARIALGAGDVIAGRQPLYESPTNIPVAGGFIQRFIKHPTGGRFSDAIDNRLQSWAKDELKKSGMDWEPSIVRKEISNTPITINERADFQIAVNKYLDDRLRVIMSRESWKNASPERRLEMVRDAASYARQRAEPEILRTIDFDERKRRRKEAKK